MGQCWAACTYRCEETCSCFKVSRGHNRYTEFAPQDKEKYSDEKLLNQLQGTTEADADVAQLGGRTYSYYDEEEEAAKFEDSSGHPTGKGRQRVGSVDSTDGRDGETGHAGEGHPEKSAKREVVRGEGEKFDEEDQSESGVRDALVASSSTPQNVATTQPQVEVEMTENSAMMETA